MDVVRVELGLIGEEWTALEAGADRIRNRI
jgi:hypothetical protein